MCFFDLAIKILLLLWSCSSPLLSSALTSPSKSAKSTTLASATQSTTSTAGSVGLMSSKIRHHFHASPTLQQMAPPVPQPRATSPRSSANFLIPAVSSGATAGAPIRMQQPPRVTPPQTIVLPTMPTSVTTAAAPTPVRMISSVTETTPSTSTTVR